MKKIVIFFVIVIAILGTFCYIYGQEKIAHNVKVANNKQYEKLIDTEISGVELASTINKVINSNEENNVDKDKNEVFINNNENSIEVTIKFKDSENIFHIEQIYNNDIKKFIELYSISKFKCISLTYHKKTKMVKSMYFEEV